MGWLKGKSTGNQPDFPMKIMGFPVIFPLNQSIDRKPFMKSHGSCRIVPVAGHHRAVPAPQVMEDLRQDDRLEPAVRQDCAEAPSLRSMQARFMEGSWIIDEMLDVWGFVMFCADVENDFFSWGNDAESPNFMRSMAWWLVISGNRFAGKPGCKLVRFNTYAGFLWLLSGRMVTHRIQLHWISKGWLSTAHRAAQDYP